ncbi:23S rRNA (pseudouridine(1915)-N(3))-methyltransferase RlmH [Persicirhabdus sediminis]|uniref:Ribosomal RNA large subunit methyltransferase H n=1 Tax=Persicirhabdus sediminis TaxID=454144 RepID=A0A8J7MFD2_9BACT|nr:23S rRNA (pseudouridine(1915)-N(3))-methyltransferase RlmH [Persicirhabdus sediminis]MBK1791997.1 23S rRNA (pseudouridine(1915)-N(3))-methyltransferase RlmH [Persicirhabdus sediminis]
MKHLIIAAGKPSLSYAKDGVAEYLKRLRRYGNFEIKHIKDGSSEDVSARLLAASEGCLRVAMDERGESLTTGELVTRVNKWEMRGTKRVAYLIGASDGHTQALRDRADMIWGLSSLTMMHELALLVLVEQIYRVHTIKRGEPYHR